MSGLVHDVAIGTVGDKYASTVIGWLHNAFDGQSSLPAFNQLTQVRYFVVGGHPDTGINVAAILTELVRMGVNIAGVALTTEPDQNDLVKGVVVSPGGDIRYTTYRAEPKHTKEREIDNVGFTSAGSGNPFGGFSKPGSSGGFNPPRKVNK